MPIVHCDADNPTRTLQQSLSNYTDSTPVHKGPGLAQTVLLSPLRLDTIFFLMRLRSGRQFVGGLYFKPRAVNRAVSNINISQLV